MRTLVRGWWLVVAGVTAACNEVPVRNLTASYVVQVQQVRDRGSPAKLDILWIVDDSPSMCQEQQSLAASFNTFLDVFRKYTGAIDMRLAVTTTNVCGPRTCSSDEDCGPGSCGEYLWGDKTVKVCYCSADGKCRSGSTCALVGGKRVCLPDDAVRGKFLYAPSTLQPPECVEKRVVPCVTDADCQKNPSLPDSEKWVCKTDGAQYLYTCDKPAQYGPDPYEGDLLYVVNSTCRYACDRETDPAGCARVFGKPKACDAVCGSPGGCSAQACVDESTLTSPHSCEVFCQAGPECEARCNAVLQDASACNRICTDQDCFSTCQKITKAPHCDQVCESSWDCRTFCETYLHDQAGCEQVCTAADCYGTCTNTVFPKQDFLCALACQGATQCPDRCIAEFGDSEYRCHYPGGDKSQRGCLLPPPTAYCPSVDLFNDCRKRCEILLSRPELGDLDPAKKCSTICQGGVAPPQECECNLIADAEQRCRCLAERDPQTGLPKCGSGVQCTAMERCMSYIPPTVETETRLGKEELAIREAECRSVSIPVLDQVVAERYFQAYKAGRWPGDPAWRRLDDDTVRNLVFETLFRCLASVGAIQTLCGSQEQGLLAAGLALDPRGENAEQARTFLRDDAYLLIVVVSDEDDCSSVDKVSLTDVGKCPCFADKQGCKPDGTCDPQSPGPLYPTDWFANFYKSLKSDPAQVFFAAIVGDVIPDSPTSPSKDVDAIRSRFFQCKCDKDPKAANTYACLSAQGKADLGSRYIQVAGRFAPYGQVSNICDDQGLRPALDAIARIVVPSLQAICLPRPIAWPCLTTCQETFGSIERCKSLCLSGQEECRDRCASLFGDETGCARVCDMPSQVEVWVVGADGQRVRQVSNLEDPENWDYTFVRNKPQCEKFDENAGYRTENAIQFKRPLEPSERVEIVYLSEPFYGK